MPQNEDQIRTAPSRGGNRQFQAPVRVTPKLLMLQLFPVQQLQHFFCYPRFFELSLIWESAVNAAPIYPQQPRRLRDVATGLGQRALDQDLFCGVQIQWNCF